MIRAEKAGVDDDVDDDARARVAARETTTTARAVVSASRVRVDARRDRGGGMEDVHETERGRLTRGGLKMSVKCQMSCRVRAGVASAAA